MAGKKRIRDLPLYIGAGDHPGAHGKVGIRNMSAYIRKMALNGISSILWGQLSDLLQKLSEVVRL